MELLDIAIPLQGKALPRDHAAALLEALLAYLPWLHTDAAAGIHPIKLVADNHAVAMLSQRTRLIFRVRAERLEDLQKLRGLSLNIAGYPLLLGTGLVQSRALLPHSTLYAYRVATAQDDEVAFVGDVEQALKKLGIRAEIVCGLRHSLYVGTHRTTAYSMMLHGLSAEQSLHLQVQGLGLHRLLGCGVFVPHRSAAAVGS